MDFIGLQKNIGIGQAFIRLTENAQTDNVLVLEHDWNLIEDRETTYNNLNRSISALQLGLDVVRLRHRKHPGIPHFSFQYQGRELEYYDKEIALFDKQFADIEMTANEIFKARTGMTVEGMEIEIMKNEEIYDKWTEFINDDKYKKYL